MKNQLRLLGGLVVSLAVALPGVAAAHDLDIYKDEKDVVIKGDGRTVTLGCDAGDYALDGTWRIEHGDQDDDDLALSSIGRAVDVLEAYPSAVDTYTFKFAKNVLGRAQVKVFVTCLDKQTKEDDGHKHTLNIAEAAGYTRAAPYVDSSGDGVNDDTDLCGTKRTVVSTGFRLSDNLDSDSDLIPYNGHVLTSRPTTPTVSSGQTTAISGWEWSFNLTQAPNTDITYYASCLSRKVPAAGSDSETHKLTFKLQGSTESAPASKASTSRFTCGAHYKAIVAGFKMETLTSFTENSLTLKNPMFLGMTPQPKSRDYKFLNTTANAVNDIKLAAICLNYRTT